MLNIMAPKTKMIAKMCPACKTQIPVACKSCPCGHFFYNARRIAREFALEADYLRRTSRVRREKPNYYDSLEYDRHIKKLKKRISESRNDDEDDDDVDDDTLNDKKKLPIKLRRRKPRKIEEDDDENPMLKLTSDMMGHCNVILDHINSTMQLVTWQPKES